MKKMLLILVIVLLAGCSQPKAGEYETIDLDQIEAKVEQGYVVMDVREIDEYESGHIVSAINKPLSELKNADFNELNDDEDYVVVCQSGNRSKEASEILVSEGYEVLNVSEGMSTWTGEVEQ